MKLKASIDFFYSCIIKFAILLLALIPTYNCKSHSGKSPASDTLYSKSKGGYNNCTTQIKNNTMPDNNKDHSHGGSRNTSDAKSTVPNDDSLKEKKKKDEVIDIGMPVSAEELKRLKEKAKKLDD